MDAERTTRFCACARVAFRAPDRISNSGMGDVKRLVAEVGNELVARDVFATDELVHFFQCGADHTGFHRQMFRT